MILMRLNLPVILRDAKRPGHEVHLCLQCYIACQRRAGGTN